MNVAKPEASRVQIEALQAQTEALRGRHIVLLHSRLSFAGGTERLFITACELLRSGAQVSLVADTGTRRSLFETLAQKEPNFSLIIAQVPLTPFSSPFAPIELTRLWRLLRSLKPDLVHLASEEPALCMAHVARLLHVPYVMEVHRQPTGAIPFHQRLAAVAISSPTLAAAVVNVGRVPRELIVEWKHAPEPNGPHAPCGSPTIAQAEPENQEPPKELSHAEQIAVAPFTHQGTLRIGFAGRLDSQCGVEVLLDAIEQLPPLERSCHFAILGEGPRETEIRRSLRRRGLMQRATVGLPVTGRAFATLASLDLHISFRQEGGPDWLGHLALSMGIPSILSAVGESFELVEDQENGLLVDPRDSKALANAIAKMVETPLVARSLGQRAAERWRARHAPQEFLQGLIRFYEGAWTRAGESAASDSGRSSASSSGST